MNTNMQQKMKAAWALLPAYHSDDMLDTRVNPLFKEGFTACHDLLMPLLIEAMPHVWGSHGADHLVDGFRPQRRPIDDLVERLRDVTSE